jgi:hypothetical protein
MTQEERNLISYGISAIQRMNDIRVSERKEPLSPYNSMDPSETMTTMLKDYIPSIDGFEQDRAKRILNVFENQNSESKELVDNTFRTFAEPKLQLKQENNQYSIDYSK